MGFLSFGSKKKKVRGMLEDGQFEVLTQEAVKDRKVFEALVELLDDENPGIVGDTLLVFTQLLELNPDFMGKQFSPESFKKLLGLIHSRNPYVKENAMILAYSIIKTFPDLIGRYRSWIVEEIRSSLSSANSEQKGFLLVVIGELKLKEFEEDVKGLLNVEDKVVLPFEGKKWIPLGEIARETLEKLT
ncbi:hypothetical protein [Thermococcus sp.]|uniref:hypothetical protein n=1 Tax=Thermococcus sp. TaxID=35749 RepID=UPI00261EDC3F|nr:hypothetical protein [Thermococcus sp.]